MLTETMFEAATIKFHFFWLSANVIKMNFAQICAFQWTKVKWCFERVFYNLTILGFKNAKIKFLKKIRVLSAFFFSNCCTGDFKPVLTTWKHQTSEFKILYVHYRKSCGYKTCTMNLLSWKYGQNDYVIEGYIILQ